MNIGRKISHKLLGMLLIPFLGMSYFSVQIILEETTFYQTHEDINKLARLAVRIGSLVHETQKERGMTAGYLGSSGTKFADTLPKQRTLTDQKVEELHDYIGLMDFSRYENLLREEVSTVTTELQQIDGIRSQVDRLAITAPKAIGYYTNTNANLLSINAEIATLTDSAEMALTAAAYTNLLQSKERAGIERAVLTNTFSQNKFGPGMLSKLSMLVNEQNAYTRVFTSLAPHDQVDVYEDIVKGAAVDEVERMRTIAFDKAALGDFGIEPGYWFKTITAKIDLLKKVEDSVADDLIEHCQHLMMLGKNKIIMAASVALVSIIATILLSYWIMRGILSSITSFHSAIEYVERENDITTRINITSKDELGLMSGAFNRMFESFRTIIDKVSESTLHVASASEELSTITERNSAGVRSQQIEAEQVATAMNEMTATVQEVARNAALAAQSANEANNEALDGKVMVQTTIDAINELSSEVDNASHVIQKVESESLQIGSVLDVIRGIAEQTNLLALNAAIEAARAGEQGRGFAVVADEVRTLASRTQNSTLEIQNMIEELQSGAKNAVRVIDASRKKADESVDRAEQAGRSLESITLSVATINDMNTQIASAAEEQNAVAEDINRNIININHVAQETADSAEQTTMASEGLAKLACDLQSLVAQFKL